MIGVKDTPEFTAAVERWTPPVTWPVPCEWPGETCLIICSGESVAAQKAQIKAFKGRVIAVKHGVLLRPNADVLFLSGEGTPAMTAALLPKFTGKYAIVRGKSDPELPATLKRVTRSKHHGQLCDLRDHVSGYDSGTSAINLAYHFGATTILLAGYDMRGGHFCPHPMPFPPQEHFARHMGPLEALNTDAKAKGIRIVNLSPISAVTAFERGTFEDWL